MAGTGRLLRDRLSVAVSASRLAALTTLGKHEPVEAFTTFVSFFDWGGDETSAARQRTLRIRGTLLLAGPRFEGHPAFSEAILGAIDRVDDEVNYLYDPKRLDKNRAQLAQGQIPISGEIEDLYL